MTTIKTIRDIELRGKRVFVRVDFNVPLDGEGQVTDTNRIDAAIPTIQFLMEAGARVILASHLGRPKGSHNAKYSLAPVARVLAQKLNKLVVFLNDCVGSDVQQAVEALGDGDVALLENLRFHAGEEGNDAEFSAQLAALAEVYVNDAFGTAHRAHASTFGVAQLLPVRAAGFVIEKELAYLGAKTDDPERPLVVILGGAKVSDKIKVIDRLLEKADAILIGGAMAYTFALANGKTVGDSLSEPDQVETALAAMRKAEEKGVKLLLPVDTLVTDALDFQAMTVGASQVVEGNIPDGWEGVDIGPKTAALYAQEIAAARTVLWNGPMGIFEIAACSEGTVAVAQAIVDNEACTSIIGGGDSVTAINKNGFGDRVTFMSTGGGASLEFLEGKPLPGIEVLAAS